MSPKGEFFHLVLRETDAGLTFNKKVVGKNLFEALRRFRQKQKIVPPGVEGFNLTRRLPLIDAERKAIKKYRKGAGAAASGPDAGSPASRSRPFAPCAQAKKAAAKAAKEAAAKKKAAEKQAKKEEEERKKRDKAEAKKKKKGKGKKVGTQRSPPI